MMYLLSGLLERNPEDEPPITEVFSVVKFSKPLIKGATTAGRGQNPLPLALLRLPPFLSASIFIARRTVLVSALKENGRRWCHGPGWGLSITPLAVIQSRWFRVGVEEINRERGKVATRLR